MENLIYPYEFILGGLWEMNSTFYSNIAAIKYNDGRSACSEIQGYFWTRAY